MFRLQFDEVEIEYWAGQYPMDYDTEVEQISAEVRKRGYYLKPELCILCRWQTPRSQRLVASNSDGSIKIGTRAALSTYNETFRMNHLMTMRGVSWSSASIILHFGLDNLYPIAAEPSLWSLGYEAMSALNLDIWLTYTEFCRELATKQNISLRTLDRALWMYAKLNREKELT